MAVLLWADRDGAATGVASDPYLGVCVAVHKCRDCMRGLRFSHGTGEFLCNRVTAIEMASALLLSSGSGIAGKNRGQARSEERRVGKERRGGVVEERGRRG